MKADASCRACCVKKAAGLLIQYRVSDEVKEQVMGNIYHFLEHAEEETSAPVLMAESMSIVGKEIDIKGAYEEAKEKYNRILLEKEAEIRETIGRENDRFLAALQYAVTGNYIDFGAMSEVDEEKLSELLRDRAALQIDPEETKNLREELAEAGNLVYITDNAGEIVLDKVFISVLKELYPKLRITAVVRGCPVLNDATVQDAEFTGLDKFVPVIGNGTGIPGTVLTEINSEAYRAIEEADLCIAKGQGNFETLQGCGKNIYYLFLCKCELLVRKFQVEQFAPALINEKRLV